MKLLMSQASAEQQIDIFCGQNDLLKINSPEAVKALIS